MARTKQTARKSRAPRKRRTRSSSRDHAGDPPSTVEGKVEQKEKYLLRWQIWDRKNSRWDPYDPGKVAEADKTEYAGNHFIVNVRYKNPAAKPELTISNWSDRLLSFMRATVGDDFFEDDPDYKIEDLFAHVKKIKSQQSRVAGLLDSQESLVDKVAEIEKLGYLDALKETTTDEMLKDYLTGLAEHLAVFVPYLEQEFAPLAAKLALMQEYGHMEFDLLLYHFEAGQELQYTDMQGRPEALVLESKRMGTDFFNIRWLYLTGYAYVFNGDAFVCRTIEQSIREFKGTKSLSSLNAHELKDKTKAELRTRGELYTSLSGVFHKEYKGQRVILDPKAYANREGYIRDPTHVIEPLADEKLHLLPPDITGFNLANKICPECQKKGRACDRWDCLTWQKFDITKVRDVVFDENAWEHLVLDEDTKSMIAALVRVTDNSNTSSKIISDVITGKGGGLLSVLHGPPGTGKTLTAESIAEHLHRPMYMVGFAELSTKPHKLEANLKRILSLATAWDAVLLIDEADVFLEQRSLHELERNSLVSVALRLLEYHRGVLFLTTNRIKTFDEAFLSRFSFAIKYPELDRAGRRTIWRKFFELAGVKVEVSEEGFASVSSGSTALTAEDLDELSEKPFNGRTIKNLVRTAQALALSQKAPFTAVHVRTVVRVQEKFLRDFSRPSK